MSNPLAELMAQATPEQLLRHPRATGEGIRVAVIDSGMDQAALAARHPELTPIQGALFTPEREPAAYEGKQSSPHGTTVADVILTVAPRVQLFSADVFGPAGQCEVEMVIQALQWSVHRWKCQVVNLSLGVTEQKLQQLPRRQAFLRAVEDAYFHDVVVVAAAHNDHPWTRSYPALFAPPLLSVDKALFADQLQVAYQLRDQVEFQAHGRGYLGPFAQEPATSWAAPHLTGIAARLLSLQPSLKPFEIKTLLYWMDRNRPQG